MKETLPYGSPHVDATCSVRRLPVWFKQPIPDSRTKDLVAYFKENALHTVCFHACCPNQSVCFSQGHCTFLLLGPLCTRRCRFCSVGEKPLALSLSVDRDEPRRVAAAVRERAMRYVVLTSVTRDDCADGGAELIAETVCRIKENQQDVIVEVLIPDFQGEVNSIRKIVDTGVSILGHNIETIRRLYPSLRPQASYDTSLHVLRTIKHSKPTLITKSAILLGLGETEEEIVATMRDLCDNHCDILVIGQYLAPSAQHHPVRRFVRPEEFQRYHELGKELGFKEVFSQPLARSSFQAATLFHHLRDQERREDYDESDI